MDREQLANECDIPLKELMELRKAGVYISFRKPHQRGHPFHPCLKPLRSFVHGVKKMPELLDTTKPRKNRGLKC